jgi:hypothetical protein
VGGREVVETYLPNLDARWRPTAERLTQVVLDVLPDVEHARKWGRLTFTRDDDWHHWICAVTPTKDALKLVFHKGALLADPEGRMEGEGRYIRAIYCRSPDEVDVGVLSPVLREAAARQTEMLRSEPS